MNVLMPLLTNKVFLTIAIAGLLTQFVKILILMFKHKERFHLNDLVITGRMPSTHSALVISMTAIIGLVDGFTSVFFLSFVLALIVLRDALGVRRTAGEEGKALNKLIEKMKVKISPVHYSLGHKPAEVFVGSLIGLVVAIAVYFVF